MQCMRGACAITFVFIYADHLVDVGPHLGSAVDDERIERLQVLLLTLTQLTAKRAWWTRTIHTSI